MASGPTAFVYFESTTVVFHKFCNTRKSSNPSHQLYFERQVETQMPGISRKRVQKRVQKTFRKICSKRKIEAYFDGLFSWSLVSDF
jgi:hypothetical protein